MQKILLGLCSIGLIGFASCRENDMTINDQRALGGELDAESVSEQICDPRFVYSCCEPPQDKLPKDDPRSICFNSCVLAVLPLDLGTPMGLKKKEGEVYKIRHEDWEVLNTLDCENQLSKKSPPCCFMEIGGDNQICIGHTLKSIDNCFVNS